MSSSSGIQGSILNLLAEWWGGGSGSSGFTANFMAAANLVFGNNPKYQISDFLAFYPKFGTLAQSIASARPNATTPGTGYVIGDLVAVIDADASGGILAVTTVDSFGSPTTYTINAAGTGYEVINGLATTGGTGTKALVDILAIDIYTGPIPLAVLQVYVNLASACLIQARWGELWLPAMALHIAHFCTLYLLANGDIGSSAGQIAISGLERGIKVSKSAGDVSVGMQQVDGLEGFAAWTKTEYGTLLATWAKIVGMGPMYVV